MSWAAILPVIHEAKRTQNRAVDWPLLIAALTLLALGLVMIASASVTIADSRVGDPTYFIVRQGLYAGLGIALALVVWQLPLQFWERSGPVLLLVSIVLLLLVLLPGIGRTVNGSTRWLALGPFTLQVSEVAKLAMIIYLGGYLVRRGDEVRNSVAGFLKPMSLVLLMGILLLAEPDFGTAVILGATVLGMMFLGGVRVWLFGVLIMMSIGSVALLAISAPYRMERLTAFLNPWADPFNSGFQLTQALIAFGRGEWFGVGLGGSVQKLFYLPEAHTDFVYAVLVEELGMVGGSLVVMLFVVVVSRIFRIARNADVAGMPFAGYLCYGIGFMFALQAFINMGVNMGLLPTKGLTLPLMSYGGSSMLVMCVALALVQRVALETPQHAGAVRRVRA